MTVEQVGFLAFLITIVYTGWGLPTQIYKNYRRKTMTGQSLLMNVLLLLTFLSWVIYGSLKQDWNIVGSNAPGAVCVVMVLVQFWIYRRANG